MKKMMSTLFIAAALTTVATACGSSSKAASTTAASSGAATTAAGGASSGSADVDKFCKDVDAIVAKIKQIKADPSKAADLAALSPQLTQMAQDGAKLATANPKDAAAINACATKATSSLTAP
jgi:Spy/CpxP family protein refolding chaperone